MNKKILFAFPGQGAQYHGMGSDLIADIPMVKALYQMSSDCLDFDLFKICNDDSTNDVHQTRYTQPILLIHSFACYFAFMLFSENKFTPSFTCGHSLGEYCALATAGAFEINDAIEIVAERGRLMSEASGGDLLALPLSKSQLQPLVEANSCEFAAFNLPDQTVVGGLPHDINSLVDEIEVQYPGKAGVRLQTEGAFHTSHMLDIAQRFKEVLSDYEIKAPNVPVASNALGKFHPFNENEIRFGLTLQLHQPVRWYENLMTIADAGIDTVIEFGGGLGDGKSPAEKRPNLRAMITRSYRHLKPRPTYYSVINMQTLNETLEALLGK